MDFDRTEGYSGVARNLPHFGNPEVNYDQPEQEDEVYEYEAHVSARALKVALIADRIMGVFRHG